MLFVIHAVDKPGSIALRTQHRAQHLAYLEAQGASIVLAGPLLSPDGESMVGSLLILDVPDRAAAEAFAVSDPYAEAGLFATVTLHPFKRVLPRP